MSAIKASRPTPRCRAHVRGRCINGSACKHPHTTDPANITCNSMVTAADKGVSAFNRSYGFCALHLKNMACPYKDCVHNLVKRAADRGCPRLTGREDGDVTA